MKRTKTDKKEVHLFDHIFTPFRQFIKREAFGGFLLFVFTIIALIWANSRWYLIYEQLWQTQLTLSLGGLEFSKSLLHWINDGLMAIFFFLIGLEIKREMLVGALSSFRQAILPVVAALGGMVIPALIYLVFNAGTAGQPGWGIPVATDIAFALGILALLGDRVPTSLKVFLTAVAVADDIGAIIVIALFYASDIHWISVLVCGVLLFVLITMNRIGIKNYMAYSSAGIILWLVFMNTGIHATVAGVIVAMTIPVQNTCKSHRFIEEAHIALKTFVEAHHKNGDILCNRRKISAVQDLKNLCNHVESPLLRIEHALHPWVMCFIMPLFALANAGVSLQGDFSQAIGHSVTLGVILGLVFGKQLGIYLATQLMFKSGLSPRPRDVSNLQIYGVCCLGGIGFTMSLLITSMAFTDPTLLFLSKVGIIIGSAAAGVIGWLILKLPKTRKRARR